MNPFREDADKLFERFFGKDAFELDIPMLPAAESFIEDGKLCMRFDLPGVDPKDIDISIAGTRSPSGHRASDAATRAMGTSNAPR